MTPTDSRGHIGLGSVNFGGGRLIARAPKIKSYTINPRAKGNLPAAEAMSPKISVTVADKTT